MKAKRIPCILLILAGCLAAAAASAAQPSITASIDPGSVAVGDSARLTVNVSGTEDEPELPRVNGLEFTPVGQSTQVEIIDGDMSASSVRTYDVTPSRAGRFNIPGIRVGGVTSAPIDLQVTRGSGASNPTATASQPNSNTLPPPNLGGAGENDAGPTAENANAFLRFVTPKKNFYVGEVVPVEIKAYFLPGLQIELHKLPSLSTEAFTLNPLGDKPERSEESVGGRDYSVLTWRSTVAAVKEGEYPLMLTMPVTTIVHETPRGGPGIFDDAFFGNFFGSDQRKEVQLSSEPQTMGIAALPAKDRPADFSGAIGKFAVRSSASSQEVAAGDPVTLRLVIKGAGNFERITPANLLPAGSREWKTYKTIATFEPSDSVGYQGAKTFEQVLVPLSAGVQRIPALTFAYFDPETRRYISEQTQSIPINVSPAPLGAVQTPAQTSFHTPADGQKTGIQQDLAPNKIAPGHLVSTLRPVYLSPWFLAAQLLPIGACIGGLVIGRRRRVLAEDPRLSRSIAADRAVREDVQAMDKAVARKDAAAFFLTARGALQQRLGERWGMLPEAITLNEIETRLNGQAGNLRPIFECADAISYSPQNFDTGCLQEWKNAVLNELRKLTEQNDHTRG